jgi:TDG/mug DNA glycosylase family protein
VSAPLDDLLAPDLRLVVCGSAPGHRSARLRQYYAGPGNKFWETLAATGLTPRRLAASEWRRLLEFGIGLTDLVKDQSGGDRDLDFARADRAGLRARVLRFRPRLLCFNGKRSAKEFFGCSSVAYGPQADTIGGTQLFVAPSTSGAASAAWDPAPWFALAERVRSG